MRYPTVGQGDFEEERERYISNGKKTLKVHYKLYRDFSDRIYI